MSGYADRMRSIRDTYDVPDETPSPMRMWALMVGVVVLATVFFGVSRVLASRQLNRPPGRNQTPPPSRG